MLAKREMVKCVSYEDNERKSTRHLDPSLVLYKVKLMGMWTKMREEVSGARRI